MAAVTSDKGIDYRLLPFLLLVVYIARQAHAKPFTMQSDNALEQCVLLGLLLIIFVDISMAGIKILGIELRAIIVILTIIFVSGLVLMHKKFNQTNAHLAKVGLGGAHDSQEVGLERTASNDTPSALRESTAEKKDVAKNVVDVVEISNKFGLQVHEVKEYMKAFQIFDQDGSGDIDKDELKKLLQIFDQKAWTDEEIDDMMVSIDTDGSGSIEFEELVGLLTSRRREKVAAEEIAEAFDLLSSTSEDGSATITVEGLEVVLRDLELDSEHEDLRSLAQSMLGWVQNEQARGNDNADFSNVHHVCSQNFKSRILSEFSCKTSLDTAELAIQLDDGTQQAPNFASQANPIIVQ